MNRHYPFEKQPLPFDYTALMPHCDPDTLYFHHAKIYTRNVDMLNYYIAPHNPYHSWSLEQLIQDKLNLPVTSTNNIKHNACSVYAHELYFNSINSKPSILHGLLEKQIYETYGSISNFQSLLKQAAFSILGSGLVWLVTENGEDLHIITTQNNYIPQLNTQWNIFTLDMLEHAYYLIYPTKLGQYIDTILKMIDWDNAENRFLAFKNNNLEK